MKGYMMSENKIYEMFRFNYEFGEYHQDDRVENTLSFNTNGGTIDEVIEKFEQFLRGCGFCFRGEIVQVDFKKYELVERKPDVTVTKNFEQGINITNDGNVYPPGQEKRSPDRGPYSAYPDEGVGAWGKEIEAARRVAGEEAWSRGQTAV
jgi:hypothetical protein